MRDPDPTYLLLLCSTLKHNLTFLSHLTIVTMNSQTLQYFNGLQQETQKFQNESRTYDRQRRIEEENLKNIRLTQLQLEEKLRNISNELGQEIRTKKIEEEKHVRLRQAMASDHQAIIQITSELQGLEADETAEKTKFVKEMESGLDEIDFLLHQRENERLIRLLEGETVKSLVDTKLAAVMSEIGVGGGSSADEMNNAAWTEISATVKEGLNDILDAEERVSVALKERKELEHLVVGLRQKFAAENQVRRLFRLCCSSEVRLSLFRNIHLSRNCFSYYPIESWSNGNWWP